MQTPKWNIHSPDREPSPAPPILGPDNQAPAVAKSTTSTAHPAWPRLVERVTRDMVSNPLLCWELAIIGTLLFAAFAFWLATPRAGAVAAQPNISVCPGCIDAVPIDDGPLNTTSHRDTTEAKPVSE